MKHLKKIKQYLFFVFIFQFITLEAYIIDIILTQLLIIYGLGSGNMKFTLKPIFLKFLIKLEQCATIITINNLA